jgi:hypothetical protein
MQAGDEVWVLADANAPYISRAVKDSDDTFVGETYMHGVMEGELVKEKREDLKEAILA